jgi:hypothetical protein
VYYYLILYISDLYFYYDDATYLSRVENLSYTPVVTAITRLQIDGKVSICFKS